MDQLKKKLKEKEARFKELKEKLKPEESSIEEEPEQPKALPDRDLKRNLGCG